MSTAKKQAARKERNRQAKAVKARKKAGTKKILEEVRVKMKTMRPAQPKPTWAKRVLARMVKPLLEGEMTPEQIAEEAARIEVGTSVLSRRERTRVMHAREQQLKKMFGLDKKNKIGKPVAVPEECE